MNKLTLHIRKGDDYVWNVARATAIAEGTSLSALVAKAIVLYCTRNNTVVGAAER